MEAILSPFVQAIRERWPHIRAEVNDDPVFIMAAGWRSGSTLLQRMLLQRCLVWGEPYEPHALFRLMAEQLRHLSKGWPPNDFFIDDPSWGSQLTYKWTANLYPPVADLADAHAAYFKRLFDEPARRRGFQRWGVKMVRYGMDQAGYLHWLFPKARFLFLIRNPYDCWSSYRRAGARVARFFSEAHIESPEQFGEHWLALAGGFWNHHSDVGGQLLRYESLVSADFDPDGVNQYLGFNVHLGARAETIGAAPRGPYPLEEVSRLHHVVGDLAARMGYPNPVGSHGNGQLRA
jgi:Sulfotransferase family